MIQAGPEGRSEPWTLHAIRWLLTVGDLEMGLPSLAGGLVKPEAERGC